MWGRNCQIIQTTGWQGMSFYLTEDFFEIHLEVHYVVLNLPVFICYYSLFKLFPETPTLIIDSWLDDIKITLFHPKWASFLSCSCPLAKLRKIVLDAKVHCVVRCKREKSREEKLMIISTIICASWMVAIPSWLVELIFHQVENNK